MVLIIKSLLSEHEHPIFRSLTAIQKPAVVMHICNLNLSGKVRQEDPKSLLASQPSQSVRCALIEKPQKFFIDYSIYLHIKCCPLSGLSSTNPSLIPLPFASKRLLPHPIHSCLTTLASPFAGTTSLHRTKCLPSIDAR